MPRNVTRPTDYFRWLDWEAKHADLFPSPPTQKKSPTYGIPLPAKLVGSRWWHGSEGVRIYASEVERLFVYYLFSDGTRRTLTEIQQAILDGTLVAVKGV